MNPVIPIESILPENKQWTGRYRIKEREKGYFTRPGISVKGRGPQRSSFPSRILTLVFLCSHSKLTVVFQNLPWFFLIFLISYIDCKSQHAIEWNVLKTEGGVGGRLSKAEHSGQVFCFFLLPWLTSTDVANNPSKTKENLSITTISTISQCSAFLECSTEYLQTLLIITSPFFCLYLFPPLWQLGKCLKII